MSVLSGKRQGVKKNHEKLLLMRELTLAPHDPVKEKREEEVEGWKVGQVGERPKLD